MSLAGSVISPTRRQTSSSPYSAALDGAPAARARLAERLESLLRLRADPTDWIEHNLWIRDKQRRIIPFILNDIQRDYNQYRTSADLILKARQEGITTFVEGLWFADCLLRPNTTSALVAHDLESAQKIFEIAQLFWARLPEREKARAGRPNRDNKREIAWPAIGSRFWVGAAGSGRFGHGLTIHNLHCSEVARWTHPEEALVGLLQAVPAGGRIVMESTANGVGNHFHTLWKAARDGEGRFIPHFYTWHEHTEYRSDPTAEQVEVWSEQLRRVGMEVRV